MSRALPEYCFYLPIEHVQCDYLSSTFQSWKFICIFLLLLYFVWIASPIKWLFVDGAVQTHLAFNIFQQWFASIKPSQHFTFHLSYAMIISWNCNWASVLSGSKFLTRCDPHRFQRSAFIIYYNLLRGILYRIQKLSGVSLVIDTTKTEPGEQSMGHRYGVRLFPGPIFI